MVFWRCAMNTGSLLDQILGQLEEMRVRCPELRFGQLIATIGMLAEDEVGHSLWDVEDADFAAALERFAADMARRESGAGIAPGLEGIASPLASALPQPRPAS